MLLLAACGQDPAPRTKPVPVEPEFVGSQTCAGCHAGEYADWQDSHHDLAMQVADATTVLGDFDSASFDYFGETSEFLTRDGEFYVRTADAAGNLQEYRVTHTFGVTPLQQYLVALPGGRMQALPWA